MLLTLNKSLLTLLILIQFICCSPYLFATASSVIIDVMPIGIAIVNMSLTITNYTYLPCIGEALYIIDYYPNESTYVEIENNTLTIINLESQKINVQISYLTYLAKPEGNVWNLSFKGNYPVKVILPENAIPIYINPEPKTMSKIDERIVIELEPGNVTITYLFIAKSKTERTSPPPSQPYIPTLTMLTVIGGLIAIIIILFFVVRFTKKSKVRRKSIELDEREKHIIKLLKEHGEMSASDLLKLTGIPKASFYRRIRRLITLGYIEQVKKKGRTIYRLKK